MDFRGSSSDGGTAARGPRRWTFGQVFLIVCLVAGCWQISMYYSFAMRPPDPHESNALDELGQIVGLAAVVLAGPILVIAGRNAYARRYRIMAVYQIAKFLGMNFIYHSLVVVPEIKKGSDPALATAPAVFFWVACGLAAVQAAVAIVSLGLPGGYLPPPKSETQET
jgi:hypothetical protein